MEHERSERRVAAGTAAADHHARYIANARRFFTPSAFRAPSSSSTATRIGLPPNQTEAMVGALRRRGMPVGYFLFSGEQHGFRQAANIRRALDVELYFYAILCSGQA
jgi:hypothetical protein